MTAASPSITPKCFGAGPRSCSMGSLRAEAVGDLGSAAAPVRSVDRVRMGRAGRRALGWLWRGYLSAHSLSLAALAGRWGHLPDQQHQDGGPGTVSWSAQMHAEHPRVCAGLMGHVQTQPWGQVTLAVGWALT